MGELRKILVVSFSAIVCATCDGGTTTPALSVEGEPVVYGNNVVEEGDCGNGVIDEGERCDTAIPADEPGACPTSCAQDEDACTTDTVDQAGTCNAQCVHGTITDRINSDGCCPAGADATNDNDCSPVCGNGVKEGNEQCDDGNSNPDDDCSNQCKFVPTAYRFTELNIRDPHLFFGNPLICLDITSAVDGLVSDGLKGDGTGGETPDGFLDLSPTIVFRPLQQLPAPSASVEFFFAKCNAPLAGTTCTPDPLVPAAAITTANNIETGECLGVLMGTNNGTYRPPIGVTKDLCFVSLGQDITVTLSGIQIKLKSAQIAAKYDGNPAQTVTNGLLRGFLPEEVANTTTFPITLPVVGGKKLATLLAGGDPPPAGGDDKNCRRANQSDKDVLNGTPGWWFYINFKAAKVPWTDLP